jgi:hypothetical protein
LRTTLILFIADAEPPSKRQRTDELPVLSSDPGPIGSTNAQTTSYDESDFLKIGADVKFSIQRPSAPQLNERRDAITFMIIKCELYEEEPSHKYQQQTP